MRTGSAPRLDGLGEALSDSQIALLSEMNAVDEALGGQLREIHEREPALFRDPPVRFVQLLDLPVHRPRLARRSESALAGEGREVDETPGGSALVQDRLARHERLRE